MLETAGLGPAADPLPGQPQGVNYPHVADTHDQEGHSYTHAENKPPAAHLQERTDACNIRNESAVIKIGFTKKCFYFKLMKATQTQYTK